MHLWTAVADAAETTLVLDGELTAPGDEHLFVPFDVPAGTRELEVRHADGSDADILDWGLRDPDGGFRGWGGGNPEPAVVSEQAASRSYVPGPLPAGTWSVVIGKAKVVSPTVSYSLSVILRDTTTLAPQPERRPFEDPGALRGGPGWFAGDTHVHSRESGDADATLDEIARLALARGLDFVVVTDHDTTTGTDFLSDAQARWPELLFVPGCEYTTYHGHATAFGATAWVEHALTEAFDIQDAVDAYVADDVFFSLNHPELDLGDLCIGCAWTWGVPDGVGGLEIATGSLDVSVLFTDSVIGRWEGLADEGRLLVPLGGSDDHRAGRDTGPFGATVGEPVTMIRADELSIAALREGLRRGRTAVKLGDASDPLPDLRVEGLTATLRVTGGDGAEVRWFVDGAEAGRSPLAGDDASVERSGADGARVRAEVWRDGSRRSLTAFARFVSPTPPPPADDERGGCGCAPGPSPGPAPILGAIALLSRARRRSGTR